MPSIYKLYVEVGRLVTFNAGPLKGKIAVIVDIIDVHRVIVEGPEVARRQAHLTDLELQKPVVKIARAASSEALLSAIKEQDIVGKYQATSAYKRTERQQRRANLTDFERFVARRLRKQRANLIRNEYKTLVQAARDTELKQAKEAAAKSRTSKNVKNSFKNLARKILKRTKARKEFEARRAKKAQTATAK